MSGAAAAVRHARFADRAFIADLGGRTVHDSVSNLRHANPALVAAAFEGLLDFVYAQEHVAFVAEHDGAPAGFLLLLTGLPDEVTRMPQGFVAYMAVEPSLRRHGIARQLLAAAEDESRRRGLPYMSLMVTENNAAAYDLYRSSGYETERRLLCKTL